MAQQQEIVGEFLGIRQQWDQTVLGDLRTPTGVVTFKAPMPEDDLMQKAQTYRLFGFWRDHPRHGPRFHCGTYIKAIPATPRGIIKYLRSAPHVGKTIAERLHQQFQADAVKILREDPQRAVESLGVASFSLKRAQEASAYLMEDAGGEATLIDLLGLLDGRGFPKDLPKTLLRDFGPDAGQLLRVNPYLLLDYPRCGFLGTDALYLDLGGDPAALDRQTLCIWYELQCDRDGHTWFPISSADDALNRHIASAEAKPVAAVQLGKQQGKLDTRRDQARTLWLSEKRASDAERATSDLVAEALRQPGTNWPDALTLSTCTNHQQQALSSALSGRLGILGGSPGTGKSFTAAALIKRIVQEYGAGSVAVCAPTGKAANRLTNLLHREQLGLVASTIHRLLGAHVVQGGTGWAFKHHAGNPLPQRFIVVDESSMIGIFLLADLLKARRSSTQILFLGDVNQLPPVEQGAPLRDMIAAGVPYGELREPLRNAGTIVKCCAAIRDRRPLVFSRAVDLQAEDPENLIIAPAKTPDDIQRQLFRHLEKARKEQFNLLHDVQVLTAVNRNSPVGRKQLNHFLQNHLNPQGLAAGDNPFRVGDKIVCLRNRFVGCLQPLDSSPASLSRLPLSGLPSVSGKTYVTNGEQAEVIAVDPLRTIARLSESDHIVVIPRSPSNGSPEPLRGRGANDEPDETGAGCRWDLAYALSVHKAQGSEWPIVLVVLDDSPAARHVCNREWIYTAISRARTICVLIGQQRVAESFARRPALVRRKTFLAELITEGTKEHAPHVFDVAETFEESVSFPPGNASPISEVE